MAHRECRKCGPRCTYASQIILPSTGGAIYDRGDLFCVCIYTFKNLCLSVVETHSPLSEQIFFHLLFLSCVPVKPGAMTTDTGFLFQAGSFLLHHLM